LFNFAAIFLTVEKQADEETTVSKVVKKTTKTTVVSATEGYIVVFINRNNI